MKTQIFLILICLAVLSPSWMQYPVETKQQLGDEKIHLSFLHCRSCNGNLSFLREEEGYDIYVCQDCGKLFKIFFDDSKKVDENVN